MRQEHFWLNDGTTTQITYFLCEDYGIQKPRPMVIVAPGGGFLDCSPNEGDPVAMHFVRSGFHAAVLIYSNGASAPGKSALPQPLYDIAYAIRTARQHGTEWNVDPDRIFLLGFSAGGFLAANYGNLWRTAMLEGHGRPEERKPNGLILGYPLTDQTTNRAAFGSGRPVDMQAVLGGSQRAMAMQAFWAAADLACFGTRTPSQELLDQFDPIRHVSADTPPAFIWQTMEDSAISPMQNLNYAGALYKARIPCELHLYDKGEHGLSLADRSCAKKPAGVDAHVASWAAMAAEWMERL